jgi:hypothetical protein
MAQYNSGGAPPMTPAMRDQARSVVELPKAPRSSSFGIILLILVCAAAATGGYFVVHYLTNR